MDPLLANPPSTCCITGSIHPVTPRGKISKIGEVDTYITAPSANANGNILLYFPDAFGLYPNAFAMMDAYAKKGWKVFGVDYFLGVSHHSATYSDLRQRKKKMWSVGRKEKGCEGRIILMGRYRIRLANTLLLHLTIQLSISRLGRRNIWILLQRLRKSGLKTWCKGMVDRIQSLFVLGIGKYCSPPHTPPLFSPCGDET
jgi:hypothetical protein